MDSISFTVLGLSGVRVGVLRMSLRSASGGVSFLGVRPPALRVGYE